MITDADLKALKVYVADDGIVWYILGNSPPLCSNRSVLGFMMHTAYRGVPDLRFVGIPQNAPLMLSAFIDRFKAGAGSVEVCSPLVCHTVAERHDPARVLYAMRQYERTAAVGGWHKFKVADYDSFCLVSYLHKVGGRVDDHARRLLREHPVWTPLSFIHHLDRDACCSLLALIVDPRFYINPTSMSRGSKLRAYLGLDLKTMQGVMGEGSAQRYHTRCKLVVDSWHGFAEPAYTQVERPDHFLYRIRRDRGEAKNHVVGVLRASQTYIEFLRLNWLSAVNRGRSMPSDGLFIPEYFFNSENEAFAYYDHFTKLGDSG